MHYYKQFTAVTSFCLLFANIAASPAADPAPAANASPGVDSLEPRKEMGGDHLAIVNTYSGDACDGSSSEFKMTGARMSECNPSGGNSIQVTARYVCTR